MVKRQLKKLESLKNHKLISMPLNALDSMKGRIATAVSAAFAFVIALTWNNAIKQGVDKLVESAGLVSSTYLYSLFTALLVTLICVLGIYASSKIGSKS